MKKPDKHLYSESVATDSDKAQIDEAMVEMSNMVAGMLELPPTMQSENQALSMNIDKLTLGLPILLEIHPGAEVPFQLAASPPLYYIDTTVTPVFHNITVHIEIDSNGTADDN